MQVGENFETSGMTQLRPGTETDSCYRTTKGDWTVAKEKWSSVRD